jgi:ferredoxin-NADP reductase
VRSRADLIPLVVREITRETPTIVSVTLQHPDGDVLPPWEPGSHVDMQLITRHERQYSLCGDPADTRSYRIAVLREELSRGGSSYVHDFLRVGSRVWVRPPRNLFVLGDASSYLLLAAGIGITPMLAMARHLFAVGAPFELIYAVRSREDIAFAGELDGMGDRVRIHISEEAGRLDLGDLVSSLPAGTDVYSCGPAGFIDALAAAPLPDGVSLHLERFEPKPREHLPNAEFTVVAAASQKTVTVPADRTMLWALQGAGVPVEGSCLRGICGSCALSVLDGVPEHRDSLNPDDSSTTIYPCVSRSITPELVVDA